MLRSGSIRLRSCGRRYRSRQASADSFAKEYLRARGSPGEQEKGNDEKRDSVPKQYLRALESHNEEQDKGRIRRKNKKDDSVPNEQNKGRVRHIDKKDDSVAKQYMRALGSPDEQTKGRNKKDDSVPKQYMRALGSPDERKKRPNEKHDSVPNQYLRALGSPDEQKKGSNEKDDSVPKQYLRALGSPDEQKKGRNETKGSQSPVLEPKRRPDLPAATGGRKELLSKSTNTGNGTAARSQPFIVEGPTVTFETGRYARLCTSSVLASGQGSTVLATLVTAFADSNIYDDSGVMLSLEYKERAAARGRIPLTRKRKEAASDKETLAGRLIDRAIRPLISDGYKDQLQITCTVMSSNMDSDTDPLSINAASAALMTSEVPFHGPVAAVRIGNVDGELVANPSVDQLRRSRINMVVAGTADAVTALEAEGAEVTEEEFLKALEFAQQSLAPLIHAQQRLRMATLGPKQPADRPVRAAPYLSAELRDGLATYWISAFQRSRKKSRQSRNKIIGSTYSKAKRMLKERLGDKFDETRAQTEIDKVVKQTFRKLMLTKKVRIDGRSFDEIRPIRAQVGILGGDVHGSAIFERGDTQVLAIATLGLPTEAQQLEEYLAPQHKLKRFMLHYEFPGYSTGEVTEKRGNRREVGHGVLAEKSLAWLVPTEADSFDPDEIFSGQSFVGEKKAEGSFPYVVRVNADVLGSDGSSSMATVCSGSMALMHAGVPVERHVAGIAMGLITEGDGIQRPSTNPQFLTDILGLEDHFGDMDFKIGGTRNGITAAQLDVKLPRGFPFEWFRDALMKGKEARSKLLDVMDRAIPQPAPAFVESAPVINIMKVDPLMRPVLTRNNKEMLNRIRDGTGVLIQFEETGELHLFAPNQQAMKTAQRLVMELIGDVEIGVRFNGEVVRVTDFGVFLEVVPGRVGLLHISEIVPPEKRIGANIAEHLPTVGERIEVEVTEYDKKRGAMKLKKVQQDQASPLTALASRGER